MADNYVIEMLHITKEFPGIKANDDITLQLRKGEIHALLGENGAGKSTLMSVLFGLYQPEQGTIRKNGQEVKINNPNDANALGIGIMRGFKAEGKSILFITHKLNEIMAVSDRCSVLRKGRYIGTVDIKDTTKEELSKMMVGRDVQFAVDKKPCVSTATARAS